MWMEDLRGTNYVCISNVDKNSDKVRYPARNLPGCSADGLLAYLKGISSKDDISHIYGSIFFREREI